LGRQITLARYAPYALDELAAGGAALDFSRTLRRLRQLKLEPL